MHPVLARVVYNEDPMNSSRSFTPWRLIAMLPKIELVAFGIDSDVSLQGKKRLSDKQMSSIRQIIWHWAVDELIAQSFLETIVPLRSFPSANSTACSSSSLLSTTCIHISENTDIRWVYPYLHTFIGDLKEMEKGCDIF